MIARKEKFFKKIAKDLGVPIDDVKEIYERGFEDGYDSGYPAGKQDADDNESIPRSK